MSELRRIKDLAQRRQRGDTENTPHNHNNWMANTHNAKSAALGDFFASKACGYPLDIIPLSRACLPPSLPCPRAPAQPRAPQLRRSRVAAAGASSTAQPRAPAPAQPYKRSRGRQLRRSRGRQVLRRSRGVRLPLKVYHALSLIISLTHA